MKAERAATWPTALEFAAQGVVLMPDGSPEGTTRIVLVEGEVRHRPTGITAGRGWVLEFDKGEAWDLEVLSDLRFWSYELRD